MDGEYDVIVLGTGLKECILSGLLSVDGLKVLHMDRNDYYGGTAASLNLNQLFQKFRKTDPPASLGASREWNIDLVPKFMMANGMLVKTLIYTDVTRYLEFKAVDGSFVQVGGKVNRVPVTGTEAMSSALMGFFEKFRAKNFFQYVQQYDPADPRTHAGKDLKSTSMSDLYKHFGLEPSTMEFIGHALALHRDDEYLSKPALATVLKVQLYYESLMRFQGLRSPYIYPLYGVGELPQGFARLSAVYGGVYMLSKPDLEVVYNDAGEAVGVTSGGETAKAKQVVGDPSYFPGKVRKVGQVVRAICLMSHPIPNTDNSGSAQIILPQKQIGRKSDMYVFCSSYEHNVAPKGRWIAYVSTTVETSDPVAELKPGLALLGPIDEQFVDVADVFAPLEDGRKDKAYISTSYDATSHFETTVTDVLDLYRRITGKDLDLTRTDLAKRQEVS